MKETIKLILIYSVLFGVLAAGIFVLFILAHKSFIQYGDGYKQGYFWVIEVRQQLQDLAAGKGFHFWSWSNGLGMNAPLGYIIDPFMIIAALFPPGAIELGYTVSNLLKLYFGGVAENDVSIATVTEFEKEVESDLAVLRTYKDNLSTVLDERDHVFFYLTVTFGIETYEAYLRWCADAKKILSGKKIVRNKR